MSLRNQVVESQLNLELELDFEKEVLSPEDEEFLTLLEQVLTEVFVSTPDEESLQYLEGNQIYDLADEKEIAAREKYDYEALNEGSPDVENLTDLESVSRDYFENPKTYPLDEDDFRPNHVTGFIQIYSGEKLMASGAMEEVWKSINKKVIVNFSDLLDPEKVISIIEEMGIKWGSVFRVIFYGSPLVEVIGSRFYSERESRELVPLTESHKNILLALPDYSETEEYSESIYDWMDQQVQDGIAFGILPDVDRVTIGHWELTSVRLQEILEEDLEQRNLFGIMKRETISVAKKNQFIETYQDARSFIRNANGGISVSDVYCLSLKVLEDILFLCTRSFDKINDPLVFAQVRSQAIRLRVSSLQESDSPALMVIQKINSGAIVETHLLSLKELEAIFGILWSNIGIRINSEYKETYYDLKERLRVARIAKFRTPNKGKAG